MDYRTLIDAPTLSRHLDDPAWIVFDVRHELADAAAGSAAYAAGHVPGAIFLSVDDDLSGPKTGRNGRHPLPEQRVFASRLASLGVSDTTQVVAYDAHGGMFAARLWWMLRWIGHERVAVLDGGWPAWVQAAPQAQSQAQPASRAPGQLTIRSPLTRQVDADSVRAHLHSPDQLVVDARAPDRFRGENETLDPIGGHIPGAANRFFKDNLDAQQRFKPQDQLRHEWQAVIGHPDAHRLVAQCGSGITACHNLLALEVAGLPGAALYPGSWSEWCSDPTRPVAQGGAAA
jgi:thiosulfate/3-mercaptopyruvate sulfurtransferase